MNFSLRKLNKAIDLSQEFGAVLRGEKKLQSEKLQELLDLTSKHDSNDSYPTDIDYICKCKIDLILIQLINHIKKMPQDDLLKILKIISNLVSQLDNINQFVINLKLDEELYKILLNENSSNGLKKASSQVFSDILKRHDLSPILRDRISSKAKLLLVKSNEVVFYNYIINKNCQYKLKHSRLPATTANEMN